MKKELLIIFASFLAFTASAQLKVTSEGKLCIGTSNPAQNTDITIGTPSSAPYFAFKVNSEMIPDSSKYNFGLFSSVTNQNPSNSGRTIGILGVGGNLSLNYGVIGGIIGNKSGAGVFGTTSNILGLYNMSGKYAGYFDGETYVGGTLNAIEVIIPSDSRLTENVMALSTTAKSGNETLGNIMNMNVIKYNLIDCPEEVSDTVFLVRQETASEKKQVHYGLSAQELQSIYPDLVREGQDGYLGVNYTELVPILIRSIQELKQELDEIRGDNGDVKKARNTATALTSANASGNVLYQNTPNPFKEQTTIRFQLADNATNAAICIFDMTGKMLKKLPISSGETSISINGWELGEGMFLYTLMVNGREIDTKRMIISK